MTSAEREGGCHHILIQHQSSIGQNLLMHGLYDGEFVGYKIASQEELDTALREAIVAIDANVLLDLYRFRPQTSRDLIKTLKGLGDRLVVPHQAVREFWRHRQRSHGSPDGATKTASDALDKSGRSMGDALATWAKAVGVDEEEQSDLIARLEGFVTALKDELQRLLHDSDAERSGDPILNQLEELLAGRVTSAPNEEEWAQCLAEATRRIEAEEPPGYKDADKQDGDSPEGGAGDYLIWYQATRYAKERDRDLVIVTRDEKEDWWWRQRSNFLGPRPELTYEYRQLTGRRLFLLRPADLLSRASVLEVEVDQASPADAVRVAEREEEPITELWTLEALSALLERLDREAPVQAAALRLATPTQGGRVSREKVYELGGYADDRMLRGFTRPFRRLTSALQEEGAIPENVSPIFVASYPDGVKASYFSVPFEVSRLLEELSSSGQNPQDGSSSTAE
ncbi:PIN-like domain-containing protein [Acrocarpospora catenulata]|uniref:PIN-like domain-containing protein n=1 Tax=Acrocarpospora catenulata TaxID=2836182 RepID=UPI001BD9ABF9|nr:PIN domain-containing protein [Acrocarpospora catenulata]